MDVRLPSHLLARFARWSKRSSTFSNTAMSYYSPLQYPWRQDCPVPTAGYIPFGILKGQAAVPPLLATPTPQLNSIGQI